HHGRRFQARLRRPLVAALPQERHRAAHPRVLRRADERAGRGAGPAGRGVAPGVPVKDEDLLRILDAAAEPDPGRILDALIQATGAERGYLVTRDGIPVLRDMNPEELRVSGTLLARAVAEGRPLIASDADLAT